MFFGKTRSVCIKQIASGVSGALLVACCLCSPAFAGSYAVTNTNDSGVGSFRQAIIELNIAGDAANTISFNTSGTITLASLLADVTKNVTFVNGAGVKVVVPAVGTGSSLNGLIMNDGAGSITVNGDMPSIEVTGSGGGDAILGVGGPIVVFSDDISGSVSATAGTDEAYGIYASVLTIKDVSGTVIADAGRNGSVAIVSDTTMNITGDISGTLTATSGVDNAAVLDASDMDIGGDVSGVLTAHVGQDAAYGITADEFDIRGNISGSITTTAGRDGAFGMYMVDELIVRGDIFGTISATAGGHTAIGVFADTGFINGGNAATALDISGTVSATANGLAVGIAAWGEMNVNVTGSLSGKDTSGTGAGYAIRSGRDNNAGAWAGDNNVDDVIQLGNGATITGHVDLGGGTNALAMLGSGTMTGDLRNVTTFDKFSAGHWVISGHTGVTNMTVDTGSLRLDSSAAGLPTNTASGTLDVGEDGTLEVGVFQTAASSLDVTGAATVDGQVVFVPRTLMASGTTFTAMNMGSMAGTGSYSAPLFSVDISSGTSAVLTKLGYSSVQGLSPNAKVIADVLSPLAATATGDLSVLLTKLENALSIPELETCLMQLAPMVQTNTTSQSFEVGGMFTGAVGIHMAEARNAFSALAQAGGQYTLDPDDPESWPLLADNGDLSTLGMGLGMGLRFSDDRTTAVYLRMLGREGGASDQGEYFGYDYQTVGVSGGIDWLLGDGLLAGVNLGYATTETDFNDGGSKSEVESLSLGGYATMFDGGWYVDAALSAGYNMYDVDRVIGFMGRTAESGFSSYLLSASASGGYEMQLSEFVLAPLFSLGYSGLYQDEYAESGAGAANLTLNSQVHHSLEAGVGLRGSMALETTAGVFRPEVSVMWTHEYLTRDLGVETQIAGSPGDVFTIRGDAADRDALLVSAGAGLWMENGSSVSLTYEGEFRAHAWAHGGTLQYRVSF